MTRVHAFELIQKLAGASRQVPGSYCIGLRTRYTVQKQVITSGRFVDIQMGRLRGIDVAVKTIRTPLKRDIDVIHEVCRMVGCPVFIN